MSFSKPLFSTFGGQGPIGGQGPTGPTGPSGGGVGGGGGPTGATGPTGTPYWTLSGTSLYPNLTTYNVGIGKTGPTAALDVSGNIVSNQDATINSLTIGLGSGKLSTNTVVGYNALSSSIDPTGDSNTAIGYQSLKFNTIGNDNTAIGTNALRGNTGGSNNTAVGNLALRDNQGDSNTSIGNASLTLNTTGQKNTAVGSFTLNNNSIGNNNTSIGYETLQYNTTGQNNTGVGSLALQYNQGDSNTALGYQALIGVTGATGSYNVAVGYQSGKTNTIGTNNTYIGYQADANASNYSNSTAIGANAIITASNQIVLGATGTTGVYIPYGNLNITNDCFANSYTTTSDYRIKENVITIDNNEDFKIDNLRPVTYTNILSGIQDIGLIAHELQEQYPFLVKGEKDGLQNQSVNYNGLIPILIKEIKELKERVKTLESNQSFITS